jgi:hypothetical protein
MCERWSSLVLKATEHILQRKGRVVDSILGFLLITLSFIGETGDEQDLGIG